MHLAGLVACRVVLLNSTLGLTMQLMARYLFTTVEGLALLALFVGTPVVLTLMSAKTIRPLHVVIHSFLAVLFGVPAGLALSQVKQGDGMGGLIVLVVGAGAGLLALAFVVAALSAGALLLLKQDTGAQRLPVRTPSRRVPSSAKPLTDQYASWKAASWKASSRRPNASYQEFLEEAHPRYFPSSIWSIAAAVAALVVVGYLVLR